MNKIYPIVKSVALLILAFAVLLCAIVYTVSQPKEYPLFLTKSESAEYMGLSASDFEALVDSEKAYFGGTFITGFGSPGFEAHVDWTCTGTVPYSKVNIFEVAEFVYDAIMEW